MFSAFKKLTSPNTPGVTSPQPVLPPSNGQVQSMSTNLQRKFAKGCNYNMKIVIRGDRNTGKSCLLARLQGKPFKEEYSPTEEIQVASINWSYKNTEDVVKVEVWDVVDVAKKRVKISGLKVNSSDTTETDFCPGLDAEFLDVYQGTHGVIFMLDITKPWTMEYVRREVEKVPSHIPVLILANFADQGHHRQVTQLQIADFVENFVRGSGETAEVRWAELSLRNGFGLKFLHRFFNVPFLTLQRQSLLQQLDINSRDISATQEELNLYMESEEANYQMFSDGLTVKRRAAAEQAAPPPSASIVAGQPTNNLDPSKNSGLAPAQSTLSFSNKQTSPLPSNKHISPLPSNKHLSPLPSNKLTSPVPPTKQTSPQPSSRDSPPSTSPQPSLPPPQTEVGVPRSPGGGVDVDNFVPEASDFDNFLNEAEVAKEKNSVASADNLDSSSDSECGNPMVARYEDSVDLDSYATLNRPMPALNEDSSDDETGGDDLEQKRESPVGETKQNIGIKAEDDLEDFFNDSPLDNTVESFNSAYETF